MLLKAFTEIYPDPNPSCPTAAQMAYVIFNNRFGTWICPIVVAVSGFTKVCPCIVFVVCLRCSFSCHHHLARRQRGKSSDFYSDHGGNISRCCRLFLDSPWWPGTKSGTTTRVDLGGEWERRVVEKPRSVPFAHPCFEHYSSEFKFLCDTHPCRYFVDPPAA